MFAWQLRALVALTVLLLLQSPAAPAPASSTITAQSQSCPRLLAQGAAVHPARLETLALSEAEVRLTFLGHSSFLIESPQLVRIVTDYNDAIKAPVLPDIVTMNHAHVTHYTDHPEAGIKCVLRGWGRDGNPAMHDLSYGDVRVRNVPTNIRDGLGGTERFGNSIFLFELGRLCIAHLGHLHHILTSQQLDAIGLVDVVLAPVDGTYTLDLDGMLAVLAALQPKLIVPMHYFNAVSLGRFLELAKQHWPVESMPTPSIVLSRAMLPALTKVLVLPGP